MALTTFQPEMSLSPSLEVLFLHLLKMAVQSIGKRPLIPRLDDVCISNRKDLKAVRATMEEMINGFDEQSKKIYNESSEHRNDSINEDKFIKEINIFRKITQYSNNAMEKVFQIGFRNFERLILSSSLSACDCGRKRKEYNLYKDATKKLVKDTSGARDILLTASKSGKTAFVKVLVDTGVDVDGRDFNGLTPLHWAAREGHPDTVQFLVNAGANINAKTNYGTTPLIYAAYSGNIHTCRVLLAAGANVNEANSGDWTALHIAAFLGHSAFCQLLLDSGANIDALGDGKETALYSAASRNELYVVRLLILRGANRNLKTSSGKTPLDIARDKGFKLVIKELEKV